MNNSGIKLSSAFFILFGLLFLLAPLKLAAFLISAIAFVFVVISLVITILSFTIGGSILGTIPLVVFLISLYALVNPSSILWVVGIGLVLNGFNALIRSRDKNSTLYTLLLIALGFFVIYSTGYAFSTLFILGIVFLIAGFILFFSENTIKTHINFSKEDSEIKIKTNNKQFSVKYGSSDSQEVEFEEVE